MSSTDSHQSKSEQSQLCEFLASLRYEDLPSSVIAHAKSSILNALGCCIGGSTASPAIKARKATLPLSTNETSTILGCSEKTDFQTAALVNGIALTNADYDDTHLRTVIHPSGAVLCAILAWGEMKRLSGREILLAFIVGVEAQLRVGNSISPGHYKVGWHVTGTTGSFGAAAAVSKLLNLNTQQFYMALGHAASLSGGTRCANGTDTKTLHMGRGAQNGLLAALLAQQDFDTGIEPIEYWGKLVSPTVDMKELNVGLGGRWELLENTFKPYPCGIVIHPLIDGCINLNKKGVKAREVEKLEVVVNPQCTRLCFIRHPSTALQGVFSLYHGCAVGLLYGEGGRKVFSDEACNRSEVRQIRDLINVTTEEKLRDDEAYVTAILKNGKKVEDYVEHAVGSLARPMGKEDLERKFIDQCEVVMGLDMCERIMEACWKIEEIQDISELLLLCRKE